MPSEPGASCQTAAAMGPERPKFRWSRTTANEEHARHANVAETAIALTDASTASNAWHADASGTIPTITNS
jgi:hypothetical protein